MFILQKLIGKVISDAQPRETFQTRTCVTVLYKSC